MFRFLSVLEAAAQLPSGQAYEAMATAGSSQAYGQTAIGVVSLVPSSVDINGVILLGAFVAAVAAYLLYCSACKWVARRGAMPIIASGRLRLAAARGDVVELELILRDARNFDVNASEGGFTALHAAAASLQPGEQHQELPLSPPSMRNSRDP